ncbi:MAG TPA: hypothetical protein EYQ24_11145 [Bacteroidetes bacterium]|nr:hypothetical protein [Bacteroidota bacterium]HIL58847.1 hypothetical protein [Rhodothermales bacterium]
MRRCVPVLAALLAGLILVQTTDLVSCADEATVAQHIEGHLDGAAGSGHPSPSPGGDHEDGDAHDAPSADCLCHLVYAPTTVAPDAVALRTPVRARFATDADRPPLVEVEGPEHVPLG